MRAEAIKDIRTLVIKVGTSVLTKNGQFDRAIISTLAEQIADFLRKGVRVILVSSGAIGAGMSIMKLKTRPSAMQELQAAAAIGQRSLMQFYEQAFVKKRFSTAQILLTWDDLANKERFINAKHTIAQILKWGLVPVINENDTVATDEIRFGDNDRLSSLIAILMEADCLVILSDTDGLYAGGDRTKRDNRIQVVESMDAAVFGHIKDNQNAFTVGGMKAKLKSIDAAVNAGIPVFLAGGRDRQVLKRIFNGEDIGTLFVPKIKRGQGKDWLAHFVEHIQAARGER